MNELLEEKFLMHYGIKMRSGRYKYGSGDRPYQHDGLTQNPPKKKLKSGDYLYEKGTALGRIGDYDDNHPMYLYTNAKDRNVYRKRFGGKEHEVVTKRKLKIPSIEKQIYDLYDFTKDKNVLEDPYEYWKEHINQGGKIADGYLSYMKSNGYDALVDVRNYGGVAKDPILVISPKECLEKR